MTTLSLETSKKIYELVGEYETEKVWTRYSARLSAKAGGWTKAAKPTKGMKERPGCKPLAPAPSFSELIRILPKIGEKKDWRSHLELHSQKFLERYMSAPTKEQGMADVEKYLLSIL